MSRRGAASAPGATVRLADGRTLGYADYGSPEGRVLLYFHGFPGSRLEARYLDEQAKAAGVRLIGVDRPGMGLSRYQPGRRLLDWPDDVAELADRLRIDSFAVVGYSAGGPYALACAHQIAPRLTACGLIAGVGHTGRFLSFLARWLPWVLTPLAGRLFRDDEHARRSLSWFARLWVEADRRCLDRPGIRDIMTASHTESFRQGFRGPARDGTLLAGHPWGFPLHDIAFSPLLLWHGELDTNVPVAAGRAVAATMPQCVPSYHPGEGHLSLIVNHRVEIVSALVP